MKKVSEELMFAVSAPGKKGFFCTSKTSNNDV